MEMKCSWSTLDEVEGTAELCGEKAFYMFQGNTLCEEHHKRNYIEVVAATFGKQFTWLGEEDKNGNDV